MIYKYCRTLIYKALTKCYQSNIVIAQHNGFLLCCVCYYTKLLCNSTFGTSHRILQYTSQSPPDKIFLSFKSLCISLSACILIKEYQTKIRRYKKLITHIYHQSSLSFNYVTITKNICATFHTCYLFPYCRKMFCQ